jgi:hypothetical protein
MIADDDWRLFGQENYLQGVTLYRRVWTQTRPHWDHDHCEFCFAKFMAEGGDYAEGYTTADEYHWICVPCFADFRARFGWQVDPE